jgi:hypothetical protein
MLIIKYKQQLPINSKEYAMRTSAITIGTVAGLAPAVAFAATTGNVDNSGIFVWIFLGFCALIVVAQVIPALLLMFGLVKGVSSVVNDKNTVAEKKS